MKKLALAFASLCLAATPALACPHMDKADDTSAPRTAEKDKAPKADKAKDAPKTAKPEKKPADKKADKVSQR